MVYYYCIQGHVIKYDPAWSPKPIIIPRRHFNGSPNTGPFIGLTQTCKLFRAEFQAMYMASFCKWINVHDMYSYFDVFHAGGHPIADNIDLDIYPGTSDDARVFDFLPLLRYMASHHDISWKFSYSVVESKYLILRSLVKMLTNCAAQRRTVKFSAALPNWCRLRYDLILWILSYVSSPCFSAKTGRGSSSSVH
jgi:hypothetical protein